MCFSFIQVLFVHFLLVSYHSIIYLIDSYYSIGDVCFRKLADAIASIIPNNGYVISEILFASKSLDNALKWAFNKNGRKLELGI